jgi:hypothetical protein
VPEGTLSSRLATARRMLARRLSRYGLALSGGALAAAVGQGEASAHVPAALLASTAAAVRTTAVSRSVEILVKGALKTMLLAKLKLAVGAVMVLAALGAGGLAYRAVGQAAPPAAEKKPASELDALRRENELLKLNLEVVLEKVRAQEAELKDLKARAGQALPHLLLQGREHAAFSPDGKHLLTLTADGRLPRVWDAATGKQLNQPAAPKAGKGADKEELRRAVDALEKALKELRGQLDKPEGNPGGNNAPPK